MEVQPDDHLIGKLTAIRPGTAPPQAAVVLLVGGFTTRHVDITGIMPSQVGAPLKMLPEGVKQAAQQVNIKPLMDQVRKRSMAVEAKFSLDFGGIHLTFTAVDRPLHTVRLTDQRATEQWHKSTEAEVECVELIYYVIEQVKHGSEDDDHR